MNKSLFNILKNSYFISSLFFSFRYALTTGGLCSRNCNIWWLGSSKLRRQFSRWSCCSIRCAMVEKGLSNIWYKIFWFYFLTVKVTCRCYNKQKIILGKRSPNLHLVRWLSFPHCKRIHQQSRPGWFFRPTIWSC